MPLASQATDPTHALFVENRAWTHAGVVFVTLHVVGSNNNLGRTPEMDAEFRARNAADLAWLSGAFARARAEEARAVVVLMQANPHFETHWSAERVARYLPALSAQQLESPPPSGFDDLLAALERETLAFARPVLLAPRPRGPHGPGRLLGPARDGRAVNARGAAPAPPISARPSAARSTSPTSRRRGRRS